jgi:hypothetical protein
MTCEAHVSTSNAVATPLDDERRHDLASRLLADRVRQCVPLRHPAFGKLLQLLSIEISTNVPTAAVTLGERSALMINPDFVAERCRTDAHLSMLVMHELYHVLLGHTRLYRRATLADNWAFDCIINAQLCRLHPQVEFTSFFSGCAAADGPWSLIGPPPGWPEAPRYAAGALGDVHRRLYDDSGATTAELFALLDRVGVALIDGESHLLGNHEEDAAGGDPLRGDPDLYLEAARIVARWPMVERRSSTDDGGSAEWMRSNLRPHRAARSALRRLLMQAACGNDSGPWVQRHIETATVTPLPQSNDRRAQLQRLLGATPLLWQGLATHQAPQRQGQVAVYLDVSGSMAGWLPVLMEALIESAALVSWPLFGFSTQVHAVSRRDLRAGRFKSTGGTDIACVASHLCRNGIRRAVVITDGAVQRIPDALLHRLKQARPVVRVGLLDGCDGSFCATLGWPVTHVPPLDAAAA